MYFTRHRAVNVKPPPGTRLQYGHSLTDALKLCLLLNESGANPSVATGYNTFDSAESVPGQNSTFLISALSGRGWKSGLHGPCIEFGSNDAILGTTIPTTKTDNLTMAAWICPTSANQLGGIISIGEENAPPPGAGYALVMGGSGGGTGNAIMLALPGFPSTTWVSLGGALSANVWVHVAVVRSATTWTAYINGIATGTTSTTSPAAAPAARWAVGCENLNGTSSNSFTGYLSTAMFWERALVAAEIMQLYLEPFCFVDGPNDGWTTLAASPPPPPATRNFLTLLGVS